MSHTDKDRPFWVQNQESGIIDHDHRHGVCIVGIDKSIQWSSFRNHYRHCAKRVEVVTRCWKDEPNKFYDWRNKRYVYTCWKWEYKCDPAPVEFHWHIYCEKDYYVECIGHKRIEHHDEIPCSCDNRPVPPTCFPRWQFGYTYGGVPSAFVRTYYHKPERARERKLRDLAREYNAYGDIEDADFFNRQGRSSARWDYW